MFINSENETVVLTLPHTLCKLKTIIQNAANTLLSSDQVISHLLLLPSATMCEQKKEAYVHFSMKARICLLYRQGLDNEGIGIRLPAMDIDGSYSTGSIQTLCNIQLPIQWVSQPFPWE
jgi:hypothetical protein